MPTVRVIGIYTLDGLGNDVEIGFREWSRLPPCVPSYFDLADDPRRVTRPRKKPREDIAPVHHEAEDRGTKR